MDKKDEALKLALEALEQHGCPWVRHEKPYNEAITAIREALAEQPAQGCEFCSHPLYAGTKCKNCGREQPAQQCKYPKCSYPCPDLPDCRDAAQPASKPWVGLTDEDILRTKSQFKGTLDVQFDKFAYALDAKLREKNA